MKYCTISKICVTPSSTAVYKLVVFNLPKSLKIHYIQPCVNNWTYVAIKLECRDDKRIFEFLY